MSMQLIDHPFPLKLSCRKEVFYFHPVCQDHENTLCGSCADNYGQDEFWICCDACETWFHGKCVKITPAKAEHMKHYKCPNCSGCSKKAWA